MTTDPPDPARAALESALGARYRILRLLGRGGMGSVYLAREEALGRLVAIKVLRPDLAAPDGADRFRREARTAAHLNHPNIVPLLGFGEAEGLLYLVLGYVQGESLSARRRREGRLAPDDVRRIVADVAEALDYAHRKGVVHRDVKPDNILIEDESGRAVLADFGIAKGLGAGGLTQAGGVIGTPQYMSPEQASGDPTIDGRSDLYSLGLVAWTLLAGRPAFESTATQDAFTHRLTHDPPSLRVAAPHVPEDLASAIARAVRRDRGARWPNARAFREAIAPTTLEADDLPEPLDTLDGAVPAELPWLAGLLVIGLLWVVGERGLVRGIAAAAIASFLVMHVPILASAARVARQRGFSGSQITGALFRQPAWWPLWYPRRFRRPGDTYDRLPRPFQAWRALVTAAVAFLAPLALLLVGLQHHEALIATFGMVVARVGLFSPSPVTVQRVVLWTAAVLAGSLGGILIALAVTAVVCARRMRALGLDVYTLRRVSRTLLIAPTAARAPWRKPEVAALLGPAGPPETQPPRDVVKALEQMANATDAPARPALLEAIDAARRIAEDLSRCETRMARAVRHVDPEEADRLRDKLAGLRAQETDPEVGRLRAMVEEQLAWHEKARVDLEDARAGRDALQARLVALWRAALEVHRRPSDPMAADRLRALGQDRPAVAQTEADGATATRAH